MHDLTPLVHKAAALLTARRETIAVAESSTGGLLSAALLSVPGASAYFIGGAVVYTKQARFALLGIDDAAMQGLRSSTEPYATLLANTVRTRHKATWGLSETGASGPTGNSYGDAAGHTCVAIAGPRSRTLTLETGSPDREANMRRFAALALTTLIETLSAPDM
jgi:nicotinamide-nucleotide amidase